MGLGLHLWFANVVLSQQRTGLTGAHGCLEPPHERAPRNDFIFPFTPTPPCPSTIVNLVRQVKTTNIHSLTGIDERSLTT